MRKMCTKKKMVRKTIDSIPVGKEFTSRLISDMLLEQRNNSMNFTPNVISKMIVSFNDIEKTRYTSKGWVYVRKDVIA